MSDPLKRYELVRLLGRGGMGEVYLARRRDDGVSAALKIARGQLGEQGRLRLEREAELLSRVRSPNLPAFLEAFESRGRLVLAMEFVIGTPLQLHVDEPGEPSERLQMVRRALPGLARGLRALHELGIIHRDVKPANTILAEERCVVVDLGLARGPDVDTLTKTGLSVGTPEYLPPEQVSAEVATPSADMYQVALVARDMLAGSRRRPGFDAVQDAIERAVRPPPDLRAENAWIPAPLAEWIRRALHPDPAARPEVAGHLEALEAIVRDMPADLAVPVTDPARPTWMETEDYALVARTREEARRTGWTETTGPPPKPRRSVPARPAPAAGVAPASAPAAPPPRSRGLGAVAGLVGLGLGLLVGLFQGARGAPAAGPRSPWVFGLEEGRLILLQGTGDLRLEAPVERAFSRGPRGRLGVELASLVSGEPVEVRVARGDDVRTLRLPGRGRALPRAALHGDELRLELPWVAAAPTEVQLRAEGLVWGARVEGPVVLRGPASHLDQATWTGSMEIGPGGRLEFPVRLREAMRAQLASLDPPAVSLGRTRDIWDSLKPNAYSREPLYPEAVQRWFRREGPRARAALRAPGVALDERMRVYEALAPMVHLEWMWSRTGEIHGWAANRLLPPDLEITAGDLPEVDEERHRRFQRLYGLSLRIGGTAAIKQLMGNLKREGELDIRRTEDGVNWVQLAGLPTGAIRRADLLTQTVGAERWSRVEIHVGGRVLRLPLGQSRMWRTHGIPLEIFEAARLGDGAIELGVRLDPHDDLRAPKNGNLILLGLRLVLPRESG